MRPVCLEAGMGEDGLQNATTPPPGSSRVRGPAVGETGTVPSRPLTRAVIAELVERIRQLLADPDARLTRARTQWCGRTVHLRSRAVGAERLAESGDEWRPSGAARRPVPKEPVTFARRRRPGPRARRARLPAAGRRGGAASGLKEGTRSYRERTDRRR